MTTTTTDEALVAVAGALDAAALDTLAPLFDAIAVDDRPDGARVAALARGLSATLGDEAARALVDDAASPAVVAARFARLRALNGVRSVVGTAPRAPR